MKRWCIAVVISGLVLSPGAYAQVDRGHEFEDEAQGPHESGATGPRLALPAERSAAGWVVLEGFTSIQVNLDENGMNIVGDAANEPSIAVDPTAPNRIVVGWRQFDSIRSYFRQAGYTYSDDGGRTWAPAAVIEPGVFHSDPVIRANADGLFYYHGITLDPLHSETFISSDGGVSWTNPFSGFRADKPWIAVDTRGGPGHGNLYQAWNAQLNQPSFSRLLSGSVPWDEPSYYSTDQSFAPIFGTLDVGPEGGVFVVGWDPCCRGPLWLVRTMDAQFADVAQPTFQAFEVSPPSGYVFAGRVPANPSGYTQAWLATDRSAGARRGRIYILASTKPIVDRGVRGPKKFGLYLTWSDDLGETWVEPIDVTGIPYVIRTTWFGTMSIAPNGRVDIVFNDNRENPDLTFMHTTRYTSSRDGGATWTNPIPLGPAWDSSEGWAATQYKIGDYYDMVSDDVGAHLIYATTYNEEQDVYYLRIGDYDCNGNGVGDLIDIANGDAQDCNANGIPDSCEIAAGAEIDDDGNGIPDRCECPADLDRDLDIDSDDFFFYLDLFAAGDTGADVDGDGDVDADDFAAFIAFFSDGCP